MAGLPWHARLDDWEKEGVKLLIVRRGDSRHPVIFVECDGVRYAIKETTPHMAEREIRSLREIELRGIPALSPTGSVIVPAPPIALDIAGIGGQRQYINGDRGYTVTRLAPRVIPHVLLYRLRLNKRTKQRILSAVAVLMIEMHEHGIYWGDPSLANVLIRIDGRSILAIMADAETAELFPGPVSDGLREQDLAMFSESLAWQSEDLRQAQGLPEDTQVLDDADFHYFALRYRWLRREHARVAQFPDVNTIYHVQKFLRNLNRWSFSLLDTTGNAIQHVTTVLPGWYQKRIYNLLHITVPRSYARRFYNMILGHQAIISQAEKREVSLEEAAHNWYHKYHLPTILLLKRILTRGQDPMKAYFAVMLHKWKLSEQAGREVSLDDAILDWSMKQAQTGHLGDMDPALQMKWWRELEPVAQALEPPMIASEELEPLLSTSERPLVRLQQPELEQKLPEILEHKQQKKD
ncbi:MAG TPA: DUF4032 domain-containing protein [Ktedonobacteraceae bacterium]|nr:DUF4032 domain-containing protein [Ktedonobacteraceae bacterium]